MSKYPIHVLSLGAGVQSSTLALMAAKGYLEKPDCAIFADTQGEPENIYKWLDWLESELPFPVYRVTAGNLMETEMKVIQSKKSGKLYRKNKIPAYVLKHDGSKGLLGRQCTLDFKIVPIQRKVREILGVKRGPGEVRCVMQIGISVDEADRMKPSRVPYIKHEWPLIDLNMTRKDCLDWMSRHGYPIPPRSACSFCPFHSDDEWRNLKENHPADWDKAVQFERDLIAASAKQEVLKGVPYLHESCVPLDQVDLKARPSHGQLNLFRNECTGLCGV